MKSIADFIFPLSDLPFVKVNTVDELVIELNLPINYSDDDFYTKFCEFDRPDAASRLCRHIFGREKISREQSIVNDRPNILIYTGSLKKDFSKAILDILKNADTSKFNFSATFNQWEEINGEIFTINPEIALLPIRFPLTPTLREKLFDKTRLYERSFYKNFCGIKWDMIMDFDDTDTDEALMLSSNEYKHAIWTHTNSNLNNADDMKDFNKLLDKI